MSHAIAVLCYKRPDLLKMMYDQLGAHAYYIDNGSPEPLHLHGAPIIRNDVNGYFSGGVNFAVKTLSHHFWIWVLNNDVQGVSWVQGAELAHRAANLPDCAILSAAYNSPHAHMQPQGDGDIRQVRWIDPVGMMINAHFWMEIGGFDERFKGYGADLDLCYRGRKAGWKFYVDDSISFHHMESQTVWSEGLIGEQNNVAEMDRLMREKWGVGWQQMV